MSGLSFLSVLPQRQGGTSAMPVLIPRVNPVSTPSTTQPVLHKKSGSEQKSDYKSTPIGKSKVKPEPTPLSSAPKPSPELQLDMIIQNKPSKKELVEYLQKRCNDLTRAKVG
jgi:hypothetical protein